MIWLFWRQFRIQAGTVFGLLLALAVLMLLNGRPTPESDGLTGTLYDTGIVAAYLLPAVIGVFWGAPMVSRELESGTHRLVWNQTVTRSRWLIVKLACTGSAAVVAAGLLSLAVTWWAGPIDAAGRPSTIPIGAGGEESGSFAARMTPLLFGARGIVPVGYALFAFVLGVTAGILLRRAVPAMAVTLVVLAGVQLAMPYVVRPHLIPAAQAIVTITPDSITKLGVDDSGEVAELAVAGPPGSWVLANETVDAAGRVVTLPPWVVSCIPPGPGAESRAGAVEECFAKLVPLGYRQRVTYQPADRFWALQAIETGIFLVLSALLAWLCVRWARSLNERGVFRGLAAVTGLLAVAVSAVPWASAAARAPAAAPEPSPTLALPPPTGPHPVGVTSLHLEDTSRPDPWVPEAKTRELMVSIWYPATSPGRRRAPYMTPEESKLLLSSGDITGVPPGTLSETRTNAFLDARPAGRRHGVPLVVLSPGHTKPRSELTTLAEELASHGYLVAAIDHTYENVATTFPDGRVTTCVTCEIDKNPAWWRKLVRSRAADVSFVLDQLTGPKPRWDGARLIDRSRIAMAGHSIGGAAAIATMVQDSRVRAGIDIDGTTEVTIPRGGLDRPFLFLGKASSYTPGSPGAASWERDWPRLTGWKRWIVVTGAEHHSFTDLGILADQAGLDLGAALAGERAMEITRGHVTAFLDLHLRNRPQPLLDGPPSGYPEVGHHSP